MNISASLRYLDEVSRSPYAKSKRRPTDERRRRAVVRREPGADGEENDTECDSAVVLSRFVVPLRPEGDVEPILPAVAVGSPSLMSLIDSQTAAPPASEPVPAAPPVSQAESLFLLLAQVISED